MLDSTSQFKLPGLDGVLLYADDTLPAAFFAIRATPRVASEDDGTAAVQLIVYGTGREGDLQITGGIVTLTTTLGLTVEENAAVLTGLAARLQVQSSTPTLPVQLLAVDWLAAEVEVRLPGNLNVNGKPSMMGENRCAFSMNLKAAEAQAIKDSWQRAQDHGTITYRVQVRTRTASRMTMGSVYDVVTGQGGVFTGAVTTSTSGSNEPLSLTLSGPIAIAPSELIKHTKTITL